MYQFNEDFNRGAFFWFQKSLIDNKNWKMLSKAAKAVFPVIACHTNKNGVAFPSEGTISALAGITEKSVRQGLRDLEGFPGFDWEYYVTKKGRRAKKFYLKLPKQNSRDCFPFHQVILEYGLWHELKPASKALYPVMRRFCSFDIEGYIEEQELEDKSYTDFNEVYPKREYEHCNAGKGILAEYAGIDRTSIKTALMDLEGCFLITGIINFDGVKDSWDVYLKSSGKHFKRSYLNEKIMRKNYRS